MALLEALPEIVTVEQMKEFARKRLLMKAADGYNWSASDPNGNPYPGTFVSACVRVCVRVVCLCACWVSV